jgi:serine/threonine-protein kinase
MVSGDSPPEPGIFAAGVRIAGYLLEEQIGQGGMAVVFRALDERLDRQVALKILAPALAADDAFRQRFIRESRAAAAADHPHIIPVFEAGEAGGVLFIAMRFVRGGDVRSLLASHGALPPERAAEIVSQVASALDAAHGRGLVHRDVKPANMLLDGAGGADWPEHVYLSDFGVSKASLQTTALTGTGQFLGTLDYIAPEQIEGKPVDGRADEYALACAAFELLSGSPPFSSREPVALMYAHMSEAPPVLSQVRPGTAAAVDHVLATALAKEPAERYPSCREFAGALRRALGLTARDTDPDGAAPGATRPAGLPAPAGRDRGGPAGQAPDTAERAIPTQAAAGALADDSGRVAAPAGSAPPSSGVPELVTEAAKIPGQPVSTTPGREAGGLGAVPYRGAAAGYPGSLAASGQPGPAGPVRPRRQGRATAVIAGVCVLAVAIVIAAVILAHSLGSRATGGQASGNTTPTSLTSGTPRGQGTSGSPGQVNGSPGTQGQAGHASAAGYRLVSRLSPGTAGSMTAVTWNAGGTLVATSDKDGSTYLWNVPGGQPHGGPLALPGAGKAFSAAFSPDGTRLAAAYSDGTTYLWNVTTGRITATLHDPGGTEVDSVAFSPDGGTLATADGNGSAYLWDVAPGSHLSRPAATLRDPAGHGVWSAAFAIDGTLATGDYYGNVFLWDIGSRSVSATFAMPGAGPGDPVTALAFSHNGSVLAAGDQAGNAYLWSVTRQRGNLIDTTPGNPVWGFSFSGSDSMAMADNDGYTYLWHVTPGSVTATPAASLSDPRSGSEGVGALAFSEDGKWLVTGDTNGSAYLWKVG